MWVNNLTWILYVVVVIDIEPIRERFSAVAPFLDERGRRLIAAAEAFAAGYGGITAVATATGMAPSTIGRGLKEWAQDEPAERVRRPGAVHSPAIASSGPIEGGGPAPAPGSRSVGRTDDARGSASAIAMDLQERATAGPGAAGAGPPGEPYAGGRIAQRGGLQSARNPQK